MGAITSVASLRKGGELVVKALVRDNYGSPDVLELVDLDKPEPGDGEVLVRVNATSVNSADWHILRGDPYFARLQLGLREPKDNSLLKK